MPRYEVAAAFELIFAIYDETHDPLEVVSDRQVTGPLTKRIEMRERGGTRHIPSIPRDILRRAANAARAELDDRMITYRRVEALASRSTAPGPPPGAASRSEIGPSPGSGGA